MHLSSLSYRSKISFLRWERFKIPSLMHLLFMKVVRQMPKPSKTRRAKRNQIKEKEIKINPLRRLPTPKWVNKRRRKLYVVPVEEDSILKALIPCKNIEYLHRDLDCKTKKQICCKLYSQGKEERMRDKIFIP